MEENLKKPFLAGIAVVVLALPLTAFADAAATYKAKCAVCHGADGAGQTPMGKTMKLKDLGSPEVQKKTDKELSDVIANGGGEGKAKMPGYKDKLEPAEIDALVTLIRGMKK